MKGKDVPRSLPPLHETRYIDYGGVYARKGDWVTCENGHVICMFTRKVILGDPFDMSALDLWKQPIPKIGDPIPVCKHCGADFVRGLMGNEFHFYDGWRTVRIKTGSKLERFFERIAKWLTLT